MASDSRALTLKLLADVADFQKKINQSETQTEGFSTKLGEFGKKAAAAFAVAAAAAAAYAGKLLVEGVKAAIEDEKAQAKLALTLGNVTDATDAQIAATEQYITKTSLAFGVTDEDLRPSLERLSIATGDLTKAQNLQKLALDVAAGSGKSLETVSNALAKAYEGNTSALGRLGVGLSSTELKTMSFDEITKTLATTFKDQASVQADTLEGKIARLKVGFDETKEAIGAKLLPVITDFLTFVTDRLIPGAESLLGKFKPLTTAIANNKDEFKALWGFLDKYIVPIITGALKLALSGIVNSITAVINAVGKLVDFFQNLYDKYKQFIDFLKNNPLSKFLGKIDLNPFNNALYSNANYETPGDISSEDGNYSNPFAPTVPFVPTDAYLAAIARKEQLKAETARIRAARDARIGGQINSNIPGVTINVNGAIDSASTARQIVDLLNNEAAISGSFINLGINRFATGV